MIIASDAGIAGVTLAVFLLLSFQEGGQNLGILLGMSVLRSVGAGIQTPAVNAVDSPVCSCFPADAVQWDQ